MTTRVRKLDCRHTPAEVAEPAAPPGGSLSPRFETQESAAPCQEQDAISSPTEGENGQVAPGIPPNSTTKSHQESATVNRNSPTLEDQVWDIVIFIPIHLYLQNHLRLNLEIGIPSRNPAEALTKSLKVMHLHLLLSRASRTNAPS